MSFNFLSFDDNEDDNDPSERDFFNFSDTVGTGGRNRPRDVIRTEIILGNLGDLDLERSDGPTGYWGLPQDQALRKFQEKNFLKADGYIQPRGPTLSWMRKKTDGLLDGFGVPSPAEVERHHSTLGNGEPLLALKQPPIKLKPLAGPAVLGEDSAFHSQRSADYLASVHDLGDWPRWTAKEIQDGGPSAIAGTRDVLDRLKQAAPNQAARVVRAVIDHLPDGLKTAFVGGPVPPSLPRWVRSKEIGNRVASLQAQRDHGFDMGGDDEPRSMAQMEMRKPDRETFDLRSDDPQGRSETLECTPEKCPPGGDRTLELWKKDGPQDPMRNIRLLSAGGPEGADIGGTGGGGDGGATPGGDKSPSEGPPEPPDDPEALEREARVERILRRRAERSGQDPDEAIREYRKSQRDQAMAPAVPMPRIEGLEPPQPAERSTQYAWRQDGTMNDADGNPDAPIPMELPPDGDGGNTGKVPERKEDSDQERMSPEWQREALDLWAGEIAKRRGVDKEEVLQELGEKGYSDLGLAARKGVLTLGAKAGRLFGLDVAADNLEAFLGDGKKPDFDPERLRNFKPVAEMEARNRKGIEGTWFFNGMKADGDPQGKGLISLGDGEKGVFSLRADTHTGKNKEPEPTISPHEIKERKNFGLAFGRAIFGSDVTIEATRHGNEITFSGTVTHTLEDEYKFDREDAGSDLARPLQVSGWARPYDNSHSWKQPIAGTIPLREDGSLGHPQVTWGKMTR